MSFILGTRTFGNSTTKNGGPAIDVPQLGSMNDPTVHRRKVGFLCKYYYCTILSVRYKMLIIFHQQTGKVHPCIGTEALYRPYGP